MHFVKPIALPNTFIELKDEEFYSRLESIFKELKNITALYDMVRNYATRKPYSLDKYKLTFGVLTLAKGWDENKEVDNLSVIFIKDGLYYLGIMNNKDKSYFEDISIKNGEECYQKMVYKYFPDVFKMIPKCSVALKDVKVYFEQNISAKECELNTKVFSRPLIITRDIFELGTKEEYSKAKKFGVEYLKKSGDNDGYRDALTKWMGFCMEFLRCYKSTADYDFSSIDLRSYDNIGKFYSDINNIAYSIKFRDVPVSYVEKLVDEGKLYLFHIYNKDFSPKSKGTPNLHTLYWKAIFEEQNLNNVIYKLNGEAELFYRKKSIEGKDKIIHEANKPIDNKNPLNPKRESTFDYDIIKNKRFTEDKFLFYVPITLNFKAQGGGNINSMVLEYIKNNKDVNIIGLDRGERHLIYLSLINRNGEIMQDENGKYIQFSFNQISGEFKDKNGDSVAISTDYHGLLDAKGDKMADARVNWKEIDSIKELKEGYISVVLHKIVQLMLKYNAIIVMEDLNFGFKRGRFKVEKQVYQKFEKRLIDKLNYLVLKDRQPNDVGGVYKALQLSNKFESFTKLGKQSGFLFYVPAAYTSKIDPATGFVDLLKPKYENIRSSQEFFGKFDSIKYSVEKEYFEFRFKYSDFTKKADIGRNEWCVCTFGSLRYRYDPITKKNNKIDVTELLKKLFKEFNIAYEDGSNLKKAITNCDDKRFFVALTRRLSDTLAMRYSSSDDGKDFILSPVADDNGKFFCSEDCDLSMPQDADANGAYHIAQKGLLFLNKLDNTESLNKVTLAISNKEWFEFVQLSKIPKTPKKSR